mgnify:CR=1 FL=1
MTIHNLEKQKNESYKYFTLDDSLAAVIKDGCELQFVKNQTENICIIAICQNYVALKYVRNQTERICWLAINSNPKTLLYIREQTESYCLQAVKNNCRAFIISSSIDDRDISLANNNKNIVGFHEKPMTKDFLATVLS